MNKSEKGATFFEIVVTTAVIFVISYIIFISLDGAKEKVRINNILSSLNATIATALACVDSRKDLIDPYPGDNICESSDLLWPALPSGWEYSEETFSFDEKIFSYGARSEMEKKEIKCNEKGCRIVESF